MKLIDWNEGAIGSGIIVASVLLSAPVAWGYFFSSPLIMGAYLMVFPAVALIKNHLLTALPLPRGIGLLTMLALLTLGQSWIISTSSDWSGETMIYDMGQIGPGFMATILPTAIIAILTSVLAFLTPPLILARWRARRLSRSTGL